MATENENYLIGLIYRVYDCPDVMSVIGAEDIELAEEIAEIAESRGD